MQCQVLLDALAEQRRHVLGIMSGLSEDALRRPVLPSGWTCVGLINHLALDVEAFWFRAVMAGQPETIAVGDAWQVDPDVPAHQILDGYRSQIAHADSVLATASLDAAPAWWPEGEFGGWRLDTNLQVLMHVIAETACHAGHLDAARELLDGNQWMVITGERAGLAWT
ncbi:MAG TPA: DinB family protein [Pseudonocardiaceae bacterium]|nr:DinB family protein [Pseudonocardiaceae bacterium]